MIRRMTLGSLAHRWWKTAGKRPSAYAALCVMAGTRKRVSLLLPVFTLVAARSAAALAFDGHC